MKKTTYITLILILSLLSGCSTVKQGWRDFTAYYNTFYNAKNFYNEGVKQNIRQVPDINPLLPVRVHLPPTSAGQADFEEAIERGSSILRNHENSRYVIPALALIGKSFYYRSEFFSALEKFQELVTLADGDMQGEGILWIGRTYLEMENYNEGIQYLEIESAISDDWDSNILAEMDLVLAQLHVKAGNWEQAAEYLQSGLIHAEDREMRARGFFLLGQSYERLGSDNQALYAYSQITDIRTSYDLEFNAMRKEADVARRIGDYDRAEILYRQMTRDDKFFDYRNELQYEIARTIQLKGEADLALEAYNRVLKDRLQQPSNITRAKAYFGMGEIFRDQLEDYTIAAAYFDSAASQRVDAALVPQNFNARELADSFGQYAAIRAEINHRDSLLHVAQLSPDELDSLVQEIQIAEMERLEQERSEMQQNRDRMLVAQETDSIMDASEATEHGFLNIRSQTMLGDASLQFQAVWGDRPLADNWRRRADVRGSRFDQLVIAGKEDEEIIISDEAGNAGSVPAVDLSEVPFTDEEQEAMREEILDHKYRLANVFFLSLDKPDSAKTYYRSVADQSSKSNLVTMSLYTLAEIELLQDNDAAAQENFEELYALAPGSVYALRLAERVGKEISPLEEVDDVIRVEHQYSSLFGEVDDTLAVNRAEKLLELAENGANESQRALLLYEAAKEYMQAAQQETETRQMILQWFAEQDAINEQKKNFDALRDSSRIMIEDSTLTESELEKWQQIADSTFAAPDLSENFPFEGVYWDSTRSILSQIETYYASSSVMPGVRILSQTLQKPEILQPEEEQEFPEDEVPPDIRGGDRLRTEELLQPCSDLGVVMDFEGGMDGFMNAITFPSWTDNLSMRGEVKYRFQIEPDGSVAGYEQVGSMDRSGIPQAIEGAINQMLRFNETGTDAVLECTLTFPVDF